MSEIRLIYGTTNPAKIDFMQQTVQNLNIRISGLPADLRNPVIQETGNTSQENARIKAIAYYAMLRQPVFSCDSGLYLHNLAADLQPGTQIRRVGGRTLNDEEMISYYSQLSTTQGGKIVACYQNAICLVVNENTVIEADGPSLASENFLILSRPHQRREAGFPLDCLSAVVNTGQYYYDLPDYRHNDSHSAQGFHVFFKELAKNWKYGFEH